MALGIIVTACGIAIVLFAASLLFVRVTEMVFAGFVVFLIVGFIVTQLGSALIKGDRKAIKEALWFLSFITRRTP